MIEFHKPLTIIVGHNGAGKTVRSLCMKLRLAKAALFAVCKKCACITCFSKWQAWRTWSKG